MLDLLYCIPSETRWFNGTEEGTLRKHRGAGTWDASSFRGMYISTEVANSIPDLAYLKLQNLGGTWHTQDR